MLSDRIRSRNSLGSYATLDPPEVTLGERLFLEHRHAQFFAANMVAEDVNAHLVTGYPVVDNMVTTTGSFPSPFAGLSMSCRQYLFVDDAADAPGGSVRTYTDFARRSPIPSRSDGATSTPRNSPPMVNASLARGTPFLLHFDGEFSSGPDLVRATFTGRNFGWLSGERAQAVAHIVRVIREDNGTDEFTEITGNRSYAQMCLGIAPPSLQLPPHHLNLNRAASLANRTSSMRPCLPREYFSLCVGVDLNQRPIRTECRWRCSQRRSC